MEWVPMLFIFVCRSASLTSSGWMNTGSNSHDPTEANTLAAVARNPLSTPV